MEETSLERLLRAWNELAESTQKALEATGDINTGWSDWPYSALCAALVAEIVGGTADPTPGQFSRVIAPDGKMIHIEHVTADGTGLFANVMPPSMVKRRSQEVAVVATADFLPVAVHFLDARFLEPLAQRLGLDDSPYTSDTCIAFGRLMHLALATEPGIAAAWGARTIWLNDHLTEGISDYDLVQRLRLEYNQGGDLSEPAQKVVRRISSLERAGHFKWTELEVPYNNMGATLTDVFLAFQDHYEPFTSRRVAAVLKEFPDLVTTSDLLAVLESGDRFWNLIEWPDQERALLMQEVAKRFETLGLETEDDLLTPRGSESVAGLEMLSHRERSYLMVVAGSKERASASGPIRRFIKDSGVEDAFVLDDVEIEATVIEAASALGRPTSTVDHSVWRASRAQLELF